MTQAIADRLGPAAVPSLLALLNDPSFPRHDNVVAYLAYLSRSGGDVDSLLKFARGVPVDQAARDTNPDKVQRPSLLHRCYTSIAATTI